MTHSKTFDFYFSTHEDVCDVLVLGSIISILQNVNLALENSLRTD